jgi:hypothetical protein
VKQPEIRRLETPPGQRHLAGPRIPLVRRSLDEEHVEPRARANDEGNGRFHTVIARVWQLVDPIALGPECITQRAETRIVLDGHHTPLASGPQISLCTCI